MHPEINIQNGPQQEMSWGGKADAHESKTHLEAIKRCLLVEEGCRILDSTSREGVYDGFMQGDCTHLKVPARSCPFFGHLKTTHTGLFTRQLFTSRSPRPHTKLSVLLRSRMATERGQHSCLFMLIYLLCSAASLEKADCI